MEDSNPSICKTRLLCRTAAFYPNKKTWGTLARSARFHGVELEAYGIGQPWNGFVRSKLAGLATALASGTEDVTFYCDAADTLVLTGVPAILDTYERLRAETHADVIFGGEKYTFPGLGWSQMFAAKAPRSALVTCLNSGLFIGTRVALLSATVQALALDVLREANPKIRTLLEDDDQGRFSWMYLHDDYPIALDYGMNFMVSMRSQRMSQFEVGHHCLRSKTTGGSPAAIHFNGRKARLAHGFVRSFYGEELDHD